MEFDIDWSFFVLVEFIEGLKSEPDRPTHCLDIGSGAGVHTEILRSLGIQVTQLDKYSDTADIKEGFLEHDFAETYDLIFCSHVIEHQRNCGLFLDKIFDVLTDDGRLILSAPKHDAATMIEGHINSFIAPLLIQQLIYAGFDCKEGKFLSCSGIENSVIVPKAKNFDLSERQHDAYQWTDAHRARSFSSLENQTFDNNAAYFINCLAWHRGEDGTMGVKLDPNKKYGVNLKSSRWNIELAL